MFDIVDDISTGCVTLNNTSINDKTFLNCFFEYFGKVNMNDCLRIGVGVWRKEFEHDPYVIMFHIKPRVICRIPITKKKYLFSFFTESFHRDDWEYMRFFIGLPVSKLGPLRDMKRFPVELYPQMCDSMGFDMTLHKGRMFEDLCDTIKRLESSDEYVSEHEKEKQNNLLEDMRLRTDKNFMKFYMKRVYGTAYPLKQIFELNNMVREWIMSEHLKPFIETMEQ